MGDRPGKLPEEMTAQRDLSVKSDYLRNKEQFKTQLDKILQRELTVDNIDTYINEAITEMIGFVEKIIEEYKKENPEEVAQGKELEDVALKFYDLPDVGSFLEIAGEKLEKIRIAEDYIRTQTQLIGQVITPPDAIKHGIVRGKGEFEKADLKNRLKTLLYTLQNNGIELDDIQIFEGEISPEMIRKTSYITVVIEKINRIVQVCDEEGNASYVFDMAHLQELGVNVPDVNTMSKEEKNTFLLQNRQAGQRFIQGPKWAAILESLLYEDFKELQLSPGDSFENDQELPQVSKIELDPWKGFWTDQEGKHWGPITTIIKKATYKRSYRSLSDMAVSLELEKKIVVDVFGHKRAAYSFEDFINTAEVKKYLESPQVDDAGEWEGFWIDPDTNKHYAALNIIADKLGLSKDFLSSLMAMATIHIKEIRRRKGGKFVNAYAYEDVVKLPAVREILELPIVEKAGEWKNFWIDPETGNHFGTVLVLANKLEISYKFVEEIIKSQGVNLVSKIVRCPPNMKAVVYPYELISENDLIKERISIPKAEVSGDWEGFYVDEKSDHWASINVLSAKLQISGKLIKKLIEEHSFQSKNIFNQKVVEAYKYEDISGVSRIIELREAKQVEAQGEWRGFYISPSSNEHWGPIKTIANKLKVSVRQVQKIITEKNLFSVSIKTAALGKGGIYQAYKFEDVVSG